MVDCMAYGFGGLTGPPWNKLGENADFLVAYDTIGRHFKQIYHRHGSNSNIKVRSVSVWIGAAVFDDTPIAIPYTPHISAPKCCSNSSPNSSLKTNPWMLDETI